VGRVAAIVAHKLMTGEISRGALRPARRATLRRCAQLLLTTRHRSSRAERLPLPRFGGVAATLVTVAGHWFCP